MPLRVAEISSSRSVVSLGDLPKGDGSVAVVLATASLPRLADLPAGRQVQENLSQRGQEVLLRWVLTHYAHSYVLKNVRMSIRID